MVMTLKDFVGEALSEIIFGIDEAKKRLEQSDRSHWVSAPIAAVGAGQAIHDTDVAVWMPDGESVNKANLVRFDVAVHATESKKRRRWRQGRYRTTRRRALEGTGSDQPHQV